MADELHHLMGFYFKAANGAEDGISVPDTAIDVTTKKTTHIGQSIGTSEEALNLGDVSPTGATLIVINRDTTNYVEIKDGTGGTIIAKLRANGVGVNWCCIPLGSGITAPYAIANTAACEVDIFIVSL